MTEIVLGRATLAMACRALEDCYGDCDQLDELREILATLDSLDSDNDTLYRRNQTRYLCEVVSRSYMSAEDADFIDDFDDE